MKNFVRDRRFSKVSILFVFVMMAVAFLLAPPVSADTYYFSDDFENGFEKWMVSGYDWGLIDTDSRSSSHSATDSPGGDFLPNASAALTLAHPIDLTGSVSPVLSFWHKIYLPDCNWWTSLDVANVEISTDGGFNWSILPQQQYSCVNSSTWAYVQIDLSSYKTSSILIRFLLREDGEGDVGDGWYIDDVQIYDNSDITPPVPGTVTPSNTTFGAFVSSPFDLVTTFTDPQSSVTSCQYTMDGGATWINAVVTGAGANSTCAKNGITGTNGQVLALNMHAKSRGGTGTGTPIARTVDAQAPTTTDNATSAWTNISPVTVTLTPSDSTGAGVAETKYCVDTTGTCTPATTGTSVNVSCAAGSECIRYVRYYSIDNVGNQAAVKTSSQLRQDRKAPTGGTLTAMPGSPQVALDWTGFKDAESGITGAKVVYSTSGFPATCMTGTVLYEGQYITTYTHTGVATGTIYYRVCAIDAAGNMSAGATASATVTSSAPPALGAVTPTPISTEQGKPVTFTAVYFAADGVGNLKQVDFLAGKAGTTSSSIFARYVKATNKLYLYNDAGTGYVAGGGCVPGTAGGTISNSKGTLDCAKTTVAEVGNKLTVKWTVTPKSAFASTTAKDLMTKAFDNTGLVTGFTTKGKWTVNATNSAPTLGALTPANPTSAAGTSKIFTANYSDADGYANLKTVELLVTGVTTGSANSIRARYDVALNRLYLYNNAGTALVLVGGCVPGAAGKTISNSQGTLNCAQSTVTKSGNTVTVKWSITPKAAYTGAKSLKMKAVDFSNAAAGFTNKGTWTITGVTALTVESDTYAVFRYGMQGGVSYSYQEEAVMPGMEQDVLIGVTEQSDSGTADVSEMAVAVRKPTDEVIAVSGSYVVVEQSTGTALYEFIFDGQGTVEIRKGELLIKRVPYFFDENGMLKVGTLTGQARADGSVFVLGSTDGPSILIGARASVNIPSGTYEGVEVINREGTVKMTPKAEVVDPQTDALTTDDGEVMLEADTDSTDEETGFSLMIKK